MNHQTNLLDLITREFIIIDFINKQPMKNLRNWLDGAAMKF